MSIISNKSLYELIEILNIAKYENNHVVDKIYIQSRLKKIECFKNSQKCASFLNIITLIEDNKFIFYTNKYINIL